MTEPRPSVGRRPVSVLRSFLESESVGGILLIVAAAVAITVANSPLGETYDGVLHTYAGGLSVLHWVNDGLMALFFLLVGLEIKREMLDGQLSTWPRRVLPGFAAVGGMLVPALVYLSFNLGADGEPVGWAIPAATDIAFALGILSLLGPRVPASLRVFLAALAIIDDLGAVLIIAVFYSGALDVWMLTAAAAVFALLVGLNRAGVTRLLPYLLLGLLLWFLVLRSGVHATVAGVLLALTVPLKPAWAAPDDMASPLHRLEHGLQPYVAFLVVPVFGFCNAGVSFAGMSPAALLDPVPLGIALGLFVGKQVGVFLFALAAIRLGWAERPHGAGWGQIYGVALLCGIGFTMSLFIGLLAFPDSRLLQEEVKLGVLAGSLLSALAAAALLLALPARKSRARPAAG